MTMVEAASNLASDAHRGALDKAGRPYIGHPERVARAVRRMGGDDNAVAAAWLHDVVEDTGITLDDLRARGFPEDVVLDVDALTHRRGETRPAALSRARSRAGSRLVKLGDSRDNRDPERLALLPPALSARLVTKYADDERLLAE